MDERILSWRLERVRTAVARQLEGHSAPLVRGSERIRDFRIAFWRSESHHDVFRLKDRVHPGTKEKREIERGQCALTDDNRMDEFDRDVLRIGSVRASPKCQQPPTSQKTVGHLPASQG